MKKAALLSVSCKDSLIELGQALVQKGYVLLSTSGTLARLREAGLPVESVSDYTGQNEILDGRVKTLHPKIHAGILARTDNDADIKELESNDLYHIEVVVVNLYPFIEKLKERGPDADAAEMVEFIDIGGPTMLRAAAKNHAHVIPLIDPEDYKLLIDSSPDQLPSYEERKILAGKVYRYMASYDLAIAQWFGSITDESFNADGMVFDQSSELRYGENPHQTAVFLQNHDIKKPWSQLSGKALSYNNLLDLDAGLRLIKGVNVDSEKVAVGILKHLNPCGFALDQDPVNALRGAQSCDPRSHFGGIVVTNREVSGSLAEELHKSFYEVVIAPSFKKEASDILTKKKALRLIQYSHEIEPEMEIRSIEGGVLKQSQDTIASLLSHEMVKSSIEPSEAIWADLQLAWQLCRHVKSNAIVIVKDGKLIGTGAGQMSRIDAGELAVHRAKKFGHSLSGAVAASDAFFPFPDTVGMLADAGVKAIVAPGGAKKDEDVLAEAAEKGIFFLFAGNRHFRH